MDKFRQKIESLCRNQETILSRIFEIDRRMKLIMSSQLNINESVTQTSNDIEVLRNQKNENAIAIKSIDMKLQEIDKELIMPNDNVHKNPIDKTSMRKSKILSIKSCNICEQSFKRNCDLEKHMDRQHVESERLKCAKCEKTFLLNWRLEKHELMHEKIVKPCKYFISNLDCPFEQLGCKFLHQSLPSAVIRGDDQSKICDDKDILEKKIETLEEKLKTQDSDHNEYSIKTEDKIKSLETTNKLLKEKALQYRSALKRLTDATAMK